MGCFVTSLSEACATCIFDMMFSLSADGILASRVLLGTALSILIHLQEPIAGCSEAEDVMHVMAQYLVDLGDDAEASSAFLKSAASVIAGLDLERLRESRAVHRLQVASDFAAFEHKRAQRRDERRLMTTTSTVPTTAPTLARKGSFFSNSRFRSSWRRAKARRAARANPAPDPPGPRWAEDRGTHGTK